ncbi:sensor domain-containing phosphodiesterase [Idiomarina seosinensis]|uniref:sensor domain-containing phosphodiesterase n=1 Tax=Idiomarina seosinensis TaxID=281739 RepID=UPI00384F625F
MQKDYESKRLAALRQLNLLDTPPSESFDRITRLASKLFDLPIAAVSLSDEDRQWFKSRVGVEHREIPRFKACCGEVSDTSGFVVVPDLLESTMYQNSGLAESGIRFYAGAPLTTQEGYTLGAMCVLGHEPRQITDDERALLSDMAAMVMDQIELQHAFGRLDPITGLPNRNQFIEDIDDLRKDEGQGLWYALHIDLFDESQIRSLQRVVGLPSLDNMAHDVGRHLKSNLAHGDWLYYIGGCEYLYLVRNDDTHIDQIGSNIWRLVKDVVVSESLSLLHTPVVGIAPFDLSNANGADIIRTVHSASQDARLKGEPVILYSQQLDNEHRRRFTILHDFRKALEKPGELYLQFQPRLNLSSGKCQSVEALLRWQHPELGEISPAEFVPLIENTSLVRELTGWVLQHCIEQIKSWQEQGHELQVAMNVSGNNLDEAGFAQHILSALHEADVRTHWLELELTESAIVSHSKQAMAQLTTLADAGVSIAIDDFGTGYNSLTYLHDIPAHVVKIDRAFVFDIEKSHRNQAIVNAMIGMAQRLGYRVVAEGVENKASCDYLRELGCDEIQGYWYSRPTSADKCSTLTQT